MVHFMTLDFFSLSKADLTDWFVSNNEATFRVKQLLDWVYNRGVDDVSQMSNLSLSLREKVAKAFSFSTLDFVRCSDSGDGETYKYLWRLSDGKLVESVLICSGERRTVCVSSQVGCAARCAFCASGQKGLFRNLSSAEILEQVWRINGMLKEKGERVSHIVFMGMGEPMDNYDSVVKAIQQLISPDAVGISQRRITVSTVGVVDGIRKLASENFTVNLALSLHAPNQEVRKKIMRYARKYPLEEVMDAMDVYAMKTKRDITYEYILISGINDQLNHADELVDLVRSRQCTVNLIPYNPVPGLRLKRPQRQDIEGFQRVLKRQRINHTCRYTKGDDIAAACGQLAMMEEFA
ncbi:Probable dual-specificity RNA methyltransferase RlmN 2 [Chlamydiales bacterium SCGC AG-110-M15]|nr:Probable dual-specificity RNA methyltransferase RlmN 2 [Chlamydiales bacterium SCGC AG-110-M15]